MKNKILTFHNLLAVLGVLAILLFLCPAFQLHRPDTASEVQYINYNLFTVIFGGSLGSEVNKYLTNPAYFTVCAPLIAAFIFIIVGILCNIGSNKFKWLNFFGFAFYAAAGILFLCGEMIVKNISLGDQFQAIGKFYWQGGIVAVGSLLCSLSFVSLIAALMGTSKPRVQETY